MIIGSDVRYNLNNREAIDIARERLKDSYPKNLLDVSSCQPEEVDHYSAMLSSCDLHGEFNVKVFQFFGRSFHIDSKCPKCKEIHENELQKEEQKVKKEIEAFKIEKALGEERDYLLSNGFSKRYLDKSFEDYIADSEDKSKALNRCKDLCESVLDESGFNLIMVGGVGTGKTHLANSMVKQLYKKNKRATRINLIELIRDLKSTWNKDSEYSESDVIKHYINRDLLIIDEIGLQFNSDTEKLFVFDIINGRYENCLPTVLISNLDIEGVKGVVGDRCVDRLREDGGKVIAFDWESHR